MDLSNMWDEYRENLKKMSYEELLESHIHESKIRYQLEETLKKYGLRLDSLGEWDSYDWIFPK